MATFGKTSDGSNVQTFSGDRAYVCQATPSSSGTVDSGWGRVRVTSASTSEARMVIYSDNAGEPDDFLAQSDEVVVNWTTSTLTEFVFSGANQISIVSGTPYWIGFWFDDPGTPSFEMKRDNTANVVRFGAVTYPAGTPEDPFVADGSSNGPLNAYIEYTEAGGTGDSERGLYTWGKTTDASERTLYTKGEASTNSERGLYSAGLADTNSERNLYTIGSIAESSERGLYTAGLVNTESERGLYTAGVASTESERGLYTIGAIDSDSERGLYTAGVADTSSERGLYTAGTAEADSERGLYTIGQIAEDSERGLYTAGTTTTESERSLYTEGALEEGSDGSERGLYTEGVLTGDSERGLYIDAYAEGTSERGLYTEGSLDDSSERSLYTEGRATGTSERGLYTSAIQRYELSLTDNVKVWQFFRMRQNDIEVFWKKVKALQSVFFKLLSNTSVWTVLGKKLSTWTKEQDSNTATWNKETGKDSAEWEKTTLGRVGMFAYNKLLTEDREITDSVSIYLLEDHFGTEGFGTDIIGKEHITS